MPRMNDSQPKRFFYLLLMVSAVVTVAPVLAVRALPFVDYPIHLALLKIFTNSVLHGRAAEPWFSIQWFNPYLGMFALGTVFSSWLPIEAAGKCLLVCYLLLTPLSLLYFYRRIGADERYVLFVFPFLYNFNLYWGFMPFFLSFPLIFWLLGSASEHCREPSTWRLARTVLVSLALFMMHLFGLMLAAPLCFLLALAEMRKRHRAVIHWFSLVPVLLVALLWYHDLTFSAADRFFFPKNWRNSPLSFKLSFFPDFVLAGDPGWLNRWLFGLAMALLLSALLLSVRRRQAATMRLWTTIQEQRSRLLIVLYFIGLYCLAPYALLNAVWLYHRTAFFICAALPLLLPKAPGRWINAWMTLMVALTVCQAFGAERRFEHFNQEAAPFFRCLDRAEAGKNLIPKLFNERSEWADHTPYTHFPFYYELVKGGHVPNPFAVLAHMVVSYAEPYKQFMIGQCFPQPSQAAAGILLDNSLFSPDYILVRLAAPAPLPALLHKLELEARATELACAEQDWILIRILPSESAVQ